MQQLMAIMSASGLTVSIKPASTSFAEINKPLSLEFR
jgi:hypothetical protein